MTVQILDQIHYEGKAYSLGSLPDLPPAPLLVRSSDGRPFGDSELDLRAAASTACWRRYVAHWSIRDGMLCLDGLHGLVRLSTPGPVPAHWYSGLLILFDGATLDPGSFGFDRICERERGLRIRMGQLVDDHWRDMRQKHRKISPLYRMFSSSALGVRPSGGSTQNDADRSTEP